MNKKGFTLIELVGVVAIIAILGAVTLPIITNVLNTNATKIDENQKKLIISAARSYAVKHAFAIESGDCVKVSTLAKEGFLENFDDSEDFSNYVVEITKQQNTYNYNVNPTSTSECK